MRSRPDSETERTFHRLRLRPKHSSSTRHEQADKMRTKNWSGLYWARHIQSGDYEIRRVPISPGERSTPGGFFPKKGFEECYEKIRLEDARALLLEKSNSQFPNIIS